jgi:hypothetical protein
MRKPEPESLRKVGAALRRWYYVVGIELETFVQADYPATAYDTLHDVIRSLIGHLDNHQHPRVTCNLVCDVTDWDVEAKLSSLGKLDEKHRVVWPPFHETMVVVSHKRPKITLTKTCPRP